MSTSNFEEKQRFLTMMLHGLFVALQPIGNLVFDQGSLSLNGDILI